MLDKSIPWHSVIMMRKAHLPIAVPELPGGFELHSYRDERDERAWAQIEHAVLEFDSVEEALACHRNYLTYIDELHRRQWFISDNSGETAATATCWWTGDDSKPCVHALACLPEYQGRGLGYAVAAKMVQAAQMLHPSQDLWLETQTWSWKAIGLYLKLGFQPMRTAVFNQTANDYELALPLLKGKLSDTAYQSFIDRTI